MCTTYECANSCTRCKIKQWPLAVLMQSAVNAFVLYVLYKNSSYNCVFEFIEHTCIVASTWRQHKFGDSHTSFGHVLDKCGECRKNFKQRSKGICLFIQYTAYSKNLLLGLLSKSMSVPRQVYASTVQSQRLRLVGTDKPVVNVRIRCQCKMQVWLK
jgi:hypothetical protein